MESYICDALLESDPVLEQALANAAAAGLPPIAVSPNQGKLLHLLARLVSAHAILELGTLGAYSTIWMARGLAPGGRLVSVEASAAYAAVAARNISAAGLDGVVDLRVGDAHDVLDELVERSAGPFDLIFIDADKKSTPEYFCAALKLSRPGALIVVDNVVRAGSVLEDPDRAPDGGDPMIRGIRRFYELAREHRSSGGLRLNATAIPTVGSKGFDGFAIGLVTEAGERHT
ncbi:MAG: O-methyltransferase [Solirubrobacteraceae bacterium]